jgi:hypothetical protein
LTLISHLVVSHECEFGEDESEMIKKKTNPLAIEVVELQNIHVENLVAFSQECQE